MEPLKINVEVSLSDATLRKLAVLLRGVHVDAAPAARTLPAQKEQKVKSAPAAVAAEQPATPVPAPAPAPAEDCGDLPITLDELKDVILEVRKAVGSAEPLRTVFAKYNATKGSEVPEASYEACAKDLKALLHA